jgi:choice-of-anchor B domain-containing protein
MKLRILLAATVVATLALAGTAASHPKPGGFAMGLEVRLFDLNDQKQQGLEAAARAPKPTQGSRAARCRNGMAGEYPCRNVDLLGHLTLEEIGAKNPSEIGNDSWGWVDRRTDREYAIVGRSDGTAFVEITNPRNPRFVADLPTQVDSPRDAWRDIKVYRDHAYIVAEHFGHGMQVFDLTRLRDIRRRDQPMTVAADTVYNGVSNTHNLDINTDSGFAYLVGTNMCGNGVENGGMHMVDIRQPKNPTFAGCATAEPPALPVNNYVHDSQCVNYRGPDRDYRGREICFGSNEQAVIIYDVTNKADPRVISQTLYPEASYTHQGWLAKEAKYFVFNDELDEIFARSPGDLQTTYQVSVQDLDNPGVVVGSPNNTASTDHNLYIKDEVIYESNYTSGLRLFDEDDVPTNDLQEIGFFDVYPENDNQGFEGGTWSNFSRYQDDDIVTVSSIDRGIFVLETDLDDDDDDDGDDDDD